MGWLSGSLSTSKQQQTQQQTTQATTPQWVESAVKDALAKGQQVAARPFTAYTGQQVAGLDPLQQNANTLAQQQTGAWRAPMAAAVAATGAGATAPVRDVQASPVMAQRTAPQVSGVGGQTAQGYMGAYANPWQSQVTDAALSALRRTTDQAQARFGQQAASQNAFGGSREAVFRAEMERNAGETAGRLAADIGAQGFQQAAELGTADAGRFQQANMFNASASNDARTADADRSLQARTTSAQMGLEAQRYNQGADAEQAGRYLQAGGLFGQLAGQQVELGRADVGQMAALGASSRDATQQALDAQYGEFMRREQQPIDNYRLLLEGVYGAPFSMFGGQTSTGSGTAKGRSTSINADPSSEDIGKIMSMFAMSDARLKTDATPIGVDGAGVRWWRYRYLWDAPGTERVGIMAQEALEHATARRAVHAGPGGFLMVNYGALPHQAAQAAA